MKRRALIRRQVRDRRVLRVAAAPIRLLAVISLVVTFVLVTQTPASAKPKYRYDCRGRSGNDVVAAFWAQPPGARSEPYKVVLECGVAGPGGWGIKHILNPDGSDMADGEPLRQHFGGYLSDWEAYTFARTLQKSPWIQKNGRQLYSDDGVPIFQNGRPEPIGYQDIRVLVDTSTFPARIKTAWGIPEDIREITNRDNKLDGWGRPADFEELVLRN
jgi:hypothetical protein